MQTKAELPRLRSTRLLDFSRRLFTGRGLLAAGFAILALLPVFFVLHRTAPGRINIVYWDEFETALNFVIKLNQGTTVGDFFRDLFALNNEHRMVTSRLMFASSYWLTGTVDFSAIGTIGIASIIALGALLVATAGTVVRGATIGLIFSFLVFQLEHYENFLWSGSSIDHFQVVLLAAIAIVAVNRGTDAALWAGAIVATLATFTLAHGIVVWPVGAAMLWVAGRKGHLLRWSAVGAAAIAAFLLGFHVNSAEKFAGVSLDGALKIGHYWLAMLGALPAFGHKVWSPVLGAVLLVLLAGLAWRGALRREPIALPLAAFAVGAAALIAIGRAELAEGVVFSRYYVLGAVAWTLALATLLDRSSGLRHSWRPLAIALPVLVTFNVYANGSFQDETDSWIECRDRAAARFKQHGVDGRGPFSLHPNPVRSTDLLGRAEALGVYRMGPISQRVPFPKDATPSNRLAYFVDEMTVSPRSAFVTGWIAIPGQISGRGTVRIILKSGVETQVFTAVTVTRPDVAKATGQPGWTLSGFTFVRRRDRLPSGEFQIGFLIDDDGKREFVMTAHRVTLVGDGQAHLATGE